MSNIDHIRQRLLQLKLANLTVHSIVVSLDVLVDKDLAVHMYYDNTSKRETLLGHPLKIVGDSDCTIAFEIA